MLYNADGSMKKITELADDVALELEGVDIEQVMRRRKGSKSDKVVNVTTAKVNFPKKSSARDQAMKHFGLYAKDKAPPATSFGDAETAARKIREALAAMDEVTKTKS